jgi:hypothetical protein
MRTLCLLLLFCLLLAGPVAAASLKLETAPGVIKVNPTTLPVVTIARETLYVIPATATMPVPGFLNLSTQPNGATITLDGGATGKITPSNLTLVPGTHVIRLSLDGYRDYTMNANIHSGFTYTIIQMLEPGQNLRLVSPRPTFAAAREVLTPGVTNGFILPSISTDEANTNMCLSGQECLALHEAAEQYPQGGYYYLVDGPACGHVTLPNGTVVPRYCISVPADNGIRPGRVPAMVTVPAAQQVNAVNASVLSGIQANVTPRVLGAKREIGVVDSVFGFFNGLFSNPVCPQGHTVCDGGCVDLMTDSSHCGRCDYFCFEPGVCSGGECVDSGSGLWTAPIPL